jgi:hypothetical protein
VTGFSSSFSVSSVSIVLPGTILIYLGDKQLARRWLQFRDTVSPHRHEQ